MTKTGFFLLILVSLIFLQKGLAQNSAQVKKIRIDPAAAEGGSVSDYIDSVIYIPLELTKESQFKHVFQLEITDNYFVILDKEKNVLLIFTRTGEYHAKISVDKKNYHFVLHKKIDQIEISGSTESSFYDLDGKLLRKTTVPKRPASLMGVIKVPLANNYEAYYNADRRALPDSLIYQVMVFKNDRFINGYLPYPANYKLELFNHMVVVNFGPNLNEPDSGIFYVTNFDYTVYRLTPHGMTPVYRLLFPLNKSLPDGFGSDTSFNGKRMDFLRNDANRQRIDRLYKFYKKGNLLFFSEGKSSYIFNEKTNRLICVGNLVSDSVSYFLPVTDSELDKTRKSVYLNFDGSSFYFSCTPEQLFDKMETKKNSAQRYPKQLATFFSNTSNKKNGNPVLVQIKFKNSY